MVAASVREADTAIADAVNLLETLSQVATIREQSVAFQRQIVHLETGIVSAETRVTGLVTQTVSNIEKLTDAKFVTFQTLLDSNREQVRIALDATKTAIDKAEVATSRAIEKAEARNDDRFASVNEFRAQLADLISRFATLERVDLLYNQTNQRLDEFKSNVDARLLGLENRVTAMEASARGAQGNITKIYAAIGTAVALIGIIIVIANALTG